LFRDPGFPGSLYKKEDAKIIHPKIEIRNITKRAIMEFKNEGIR